MSYPVPYTHALTVEGRRREFERKVLATGCLVLATLSTDPAAQPLIRPFTLALTGWAEAGHFPIANEPLQLALQDARHTLPPAWHPVLDGMIQLLRAAQGQDWVQLGQAVRTLAPATKPLFPT